MKSVVICGSSRFADGIRNFTNQLRDLGVTVFEPHLYRASGGVWEDIKEFDRRFVASGLTHDHFYKIRMADVVYIYNQDGYAGVSTTMEIGYAVAMDKPIYVYEGQDEEVCRQILFSGVVKTAESFLHYLK